jgi:formylglycine-generating enzyme required for sulfatase activity
MSRSKSRIPWLGVYLAVLSVLAVLGIVIHLVTPPIVKKAAEPKPVTPPPVVTNEPEPKKATPAPGAEFLTTQVGQIKLKRIPAGTFLMGSPSDEKGAFDWEKPRHKVRITRPFYLGVYEVTQGQYQAVMSQNPSEYKGSGDLPVERVSWLDAVKFCNTVSEREGLRLFYDIDGASVSVPDWGAVGYRLPTEAEWEYACRAGSTTRYSFADDAARLGDFAWFDGNSGMKPHPVGQKQPNGLGLFDMHGNVGEWCWDWFDSEYYEQSPLDDPRGTLSAAGRVFRGGSWIVDPQEARSAYRYGYGPEGRGNRLGFRVARVPSSR